jgi:uroporphyrin-III C-methyltransferase
VKGKVYLVGAGPGDPELLTVKALRLLQSAEAVLHDDLISPEILKLIPATAQIQNVGKRCGKKKILQGEINCLMVALAASGLRVVRLKGGDPLIFGRAGEEMEFLRRNKIPFEIVPGVTTALGAAALAQIPLTHRRSSDGRSDGRSSDGRSSDGRSSDALVFITAHRAAGKKSGERDGADWSKLAASGATLAIYMPGQNYPEIAKRLLGAGLPAETPCAVISRATTPYQRMHRTTVSGLHRAPQLVSPTLLVVGEVVQMGDPAAAVDGFLHSAGQSKDHLYLTPAALFNSPVFDAAQLDAPQLDTTELRAEKEFPA